MRPEIDADENDRDSVREYAQRQGITMPRAWVEILREGIEAVNDDTDADETDNDTELQH